MHPAVTPADVLQLLATKDLTEQQICKLLKLSTTQWAALRAELMGRWQIATVGMGKMKKYTLLNIERTK